MYDIRDKKARFIVAAKHNEIEVHYEHDEHEAYALYEELCDKYNEHNAIMSDYLAQDDIAEIEERTIQVHMHVFRMNTTHLHESQQYSTIHTFYRMRDAIEFMLRNVDNDTTYLFVRDIHAYNSLTSE
jgi:hypothetical protein